MRAVGGVSKRKERQQRICCVAQVRLCFFFLRVQGGLPYFWAGWWLACWAPGGGAWLAGFGGVLGLGGAGVSGGVLLLLARARCLSCLRAGWFFLGCSLCLMVLPSLAAAGCAPTAVASCAHVFGCVRVARLVAFLCGFRVFLSFFFSNFFLISGGVRECLRTPARGQMFHSRISGLPSEV